MSTQLIDQEMKVEEMVSHWEPTVGKGRASEFDSYVAISRHLPTKSLLVEFVKLKHDVLVELIWIPQAKDAHVLRVNADLRSSGNYQAEICYEMQCTGFTTPNSVLENMRDGSLDLESVILLFFGTQIQNGLLNPHNSKAVLFIDDLVDDWKAEATWRHVLESIKENGDRQQAAQQS